MSATFDADRTHVRLRAPTAPTLEARSAERLREPVSPELALVDPALARRARALLPDHSAAPVAASSRPPQTSATLPTTSPAPDRHGRRRRQILSLAAVSSLLAVVAVPVGSKLRAEERPETAALSVSMPRSGRAAPGTAAPTPAAERQTFVWVPVAGASAYEFQLYRRNDRLHRARVDEARLQLPTRLSNGESGVLAPGSYRWYVWTIQRRTGLRESVAVVRARLTVKELSK